MCSDLESRKRGFFVEFSNNLPGPRAFFKSSFFPWREVGAREWRQLRKCNSWLAVKSWSSRSSFLTFQSGKLRPFFLSKLYELYSICSMVIFATFLTRRLVLKNLLGTREKYSRKTCSLSVNLKFMCWFAVDQPSIFLYTQGGGEWLRYKGKVVQV